jgi:hypothetical protein
MGNLAVQEPQTAAVRLDDLAREEQSDAATARFGGEERDE